jgi:hypothetical protein
MSFRILSQYMSFRILSQYMSLCVKNLIIINYLIIIIYDH